MPELARIGLFTAAVVFNLLLLYFLASWICRSAKRTENELRIRDRLQKFFRP